VSDVDELPAHATTDTHRRSRGVRSMDMMGLAS
jgi:hypothetical protein